MSNMRHTPILDTAHTLDTVLLSLVNTKIDIAVAFASKTESLIENLLKNGNTVYLQLGTINYFTDPSFIRYCRKLSQRDPEKLKVYVDFRIENSIHWKVYLAAPDTVIIGSPNLTTIGLRMSRDTAIMLNDSILHTDYSTRIARLKRENRESILYVHDTKFMQKLQTYEQVHRREFGRVGPSRTAIVEGRDTPTQDFQTWLSQESSQVLPLFIWEREMTDEEHEIFLQKIIPIISDGDTIIGDLYVIGTYDGTPNKQEYYDGDTVLTMNYSGQHIGFHKITVVTYAQSKWWLCGIISQKVIPPFTLTTEIKRLIRGKRIEWYNSEKCTSTLEIYKIW